MENADIIILEDNKAVAKAAAKDFMTSIVSAISKRKVAYVALSGGSTPRVLFHLLTQSPFIEAIPWDKIHFFWVDERIVPSNNPESNYGQVQQTLFQHVSIDPNNMHPVNGSLDPKSAAQHYEKILNNYAQSSYPFPRFDWCLLGMGEDGHTASLFPGSEVNPDAAAITVEADYQGRPAQRVTLTPKVINASRRVVFLVTGENKADTLALVLKGLSDPQTLPAQRIQPTHGHLVWFIDRAAAGKLKP